MNYLYTCLNDLKFHCKKYKYYLVMLAGKVLQRILIECGETVRNQ